MARSDVGRLILGALVAVAGFSGCGGGSTGSLISALPVSMAAHDAHSGSWILPEAKSEDLMYVTNYSDVLVLSYPQGKLVGTLKGFYSAAGDCVDSKGDVFIVNLKPLVVYEYAHGGTKRIATFPTKKAGSIGCAINPKTGDLATSGGIGPAGAYVEIFKAAKGHPIAIEDHRMWFGQFVTYDSRGDLFFLGLRSSKGKQRLSELKSGSQHFTTIHADAYLYDEGGIQWSGGYLTGVSYVKTSFEPTIGRFQVTGTRAHLVSQTPLGSPAYTVLQYYIYNQTVVVPSVGDASGNAILMYHYPAGGKPTKTFAEYDPRAVVVSVAPSSASR